MAKSLVKYSYNGTEYSFVSKDPAQIEDLKCPICLELVYEPVLTSCDHFFCQRCVTGHKKCPTCQSCLQCKRNQRVERKVKKIEGKVPQLGERMWMAGRLGRCCTAHRHQLPNGGCALSEGVQGEDCKRTFEGPCYSLHTEYIQVSTLLV